MKKIIYTISIGVYLLFGGCTQNFEEINTNPNNPDIAPSTNVLAYVIKNITNMFGSTEMQYPASYVGHIVKGTYTDVINYAAIPSSLIWNGTYRTTMSNLNFVIKNAEKEENFNMLAAAEVLKVYAMQMVVDVYGPVPYFEAGLGNEGITQPAFDSEEEIYTDLMNLLDQANLQFDAVDGGNIGIGDILYIGDILKWKKFCNSLHLRLAIRISNVDESTAQTEISKILSDPTTYPIFENNDDNALINYPGDDWIEPWTATYSSIGDNWMAKPLIDTMLNFNDPRISYYADTIDGGTYSGLVVGDAADIDYSRIDNRFVNNPAGTVFLMKYCEVEFIKSEAALRNLGGSSAQTAYEAAITASCDEYEIASDSITTYLANAGVVWNNDVNQIYTQKWIALFRQSWEAWAEMRRTDIPALAPASNSVHTGHNRPPFRFSYPDTEVKLNGDNIPTDVNEVDNYWGYQIWWDTRTGVH